MRYLFKIAWFLLLTATCSAALAQQRSADEEFYFSIPRLSADKALTRFARQAGITLLFPYTEVKKYKTRPLHGRFTIYHGLQLMLSGTKIAISAGVGEIDEPIAEETQLNAQQQITVEENDMNTFSKKLLPGVISLAVASTAGISAVQAQDDGANNLEEILVLGSRSAKARSAADSPVPVDVISGEEFSALGNSADITDNLKTLVPSYTATPATGDGSAFVRPTSLRGMSPDQTLVLVNGKRRHRSALVQFFAPAAGNGSHGVDVAMIPGIALKNVQVLRDGAAAQYGSDAIAGVINFELKDDNEGGEVQVQYGEFYEGESSSKIAANFGMAAGENGFINASIEYGDNDALSRGVIRPDALALVNAGIPGVGADSPFGDAPFTQTWGRPETSGLRLFVNSGWELDSGAEIYSFANYADTDGRYRFFYRNPGHPTLVGGSGVCLQNPALQICNVGFTPFLDGDQTDLSWVGGIRGEFANETTYDFSINYGKNELDYFLNNTINTGVPLQGGMPVMNFDVGGYESEQIVLNADFSTALNDSVALSYGAEWREESFTLVTGDANASVSPGPSGFSPPSAESAGTFDRDNYAVYADVEWDISDAWLMQFALRFEDYSDFGSTTNGKIATRYNVTDNFTLRGALSTGFKAPTPGQSNISSIITTFDGRTGLQVEEGLVPANSAAARNAGGTDLKEEESTNLSIGFTTSLGSNWDLTFDYYNVEVDDRIYRTGDIPIPGTVDNTLSFYTNALDVEHEGFDIVLNGSINWGGDVDTSVTFAYAHNEIEVTGQSPVQGINPVSAATIEDIENNYPEDRFTLSTNTYLNEKVNLLVRATYYGSHFDERGTINGAPGNRSAEIDSIIYFDAEVGWQATDSLKVVVGASNIFDDFIDEIANDGVFENRQSVGLQYPRRTAANYEGGSWYLKGIFEF
ncbi:MAG: TonB-dependent receptor [Pseudomonadota bacterium]